MRRTAHTGETKELTTLPYSCPRLEQLMEMLSDETNKDAITWLPHGKAFIIYRKKSFSEEVLPKHFKACKYTSFTRKVSPARFLLHRAGRILTKVELHVAQSMGFH